MRTFICLLLFLPALAMASPAGNVIKYECEQINKMNVGFNCSTKDGFSLHWYKDKTKMKPEERKRSKYEFDRIALQYIGLGYRRFTVTANYWPKNGERICTANKKRNSYNCTDYLIQKDGSYKNISN